MPGSGTMETVPVTIESHEDKGIPEILLQYCLVGLTSGNSENKDFNKKKVPGSGTF